MESENYKRFASLTFNDFRRMAEDDSLSIYEKIGFPNSYREGKEELIFDDIEAKLPSLSGRDKIVLDIDAQSGPGNLLGNLLCAVAHLLDGGGPLSNLVNLLNQILGLLT